MMYSGQDAGTDESGMPLPRSLRLGVGASEVRRAGIRQGVASLRRNVDASTGNKPCSERQLLLLLMRTMAVVVTGVVLGIYQLLLELGARGTRTREQTTIAGRAEALP